jgi:hypothetical protein
VESESLMTTFPLRLGTHYSGLPSRAAPPEDPQ